jgi:hypothetical protein
MYWNHPTTTEESERPEGNLSRLAAVTVSEPYYTESGASGPGMYADAKVFSPYADAIDEMAPHIGVSIRGRGRQDQGEAEGKEGPIVTEITQGMSVDFVTKPGAGGQIIEVFESVPDAKPLPDIKEVVTEPPIDIDETEIMESDNMDELKEAQDALAEAQSTIAEHKATIAKLQELATMRDAHDFVHVALAEADLPDMTVQRLARELAVNPPVGDGNLDKDAYKTTIEKAIEDAQSEIAAITGSDGQITGQGSAQPPATIGPTLEESRKQQDVMLADLGLGGK